MPLIRYIEIDNNININDKNSFLKKPWLIFASSIIIAIKVTKELMIRLPFIFIDIRKINIFKRYIVNLYIFLETFWFSILLDKVELDVSKSGSKENKEQTIISNNDSGLLNNSEACKEVSTPIVKWVFPRILTSNSIIIWE